MRTSKQGIGGMTHLALVAIPVILAVIVGCGGSSGGGDADDAAEPDATTTTTEAEEDIVVQASDFVNLADMTPVRGYFINNLRGHLDEAVAVAENPDGGTYPVGTVIQLVPFEAMVKHTEGFSPETNDWEFFTLDATAQGTTILSQGGAEVVNRFTNGSCADCHGAAEPQFDFVCENTHGCAPLPIGDDVITGLQQSDPRPRQNA